MYTCRYCERVFDKQQAYASHTGKCKLNPNRVHSLEHLAYARSCKKTDDTVYYCQYCGKKCIGKNSLTQHELRCKENPNKINFQKNHESGFIKYNQDCRNNIKHHPHKGQTKRTSEALRKSSETLHNRYQIGDITPPFKGKKHSEKTKEKMRYAAMNYLNKAKHLKCPRYNVKSIDYINSLNEEKGWNLQHAENGGEYEICGYYVDGYDKEHNIVFEYDEPHHYNDVINSMLKDRDIERQNIIIKELNCDFYRYNEYMKKLYKTN